MRDHVAQVYRDLLVAFRDGFGEHGRTVFCLQAVSDEEERVMPGSWERSFLDRNGTICFSEITWHVWSVAGGLIGYPDEERYQKMLTLAVAASRCYDSLAARAGSHLPLAMREAIPADPADGQSWWAALLWWLRKPGEEDFNPPECVRRLVSVSPFEESARAIEVCGLATDEPALPFLVRFLNDGGVAYEVLDLDRDEDNGGEDFETAGSVGKGVEPRNEWFREQHEAEDTDTYHSPAAIHGKWNAMRIEERKSICPASFGKVLRSTVEKGLQRARKIRENVKMS